MSAQLSVPSGIWQVITPKTKLTATNELVIPFDYEVDMHYKIKMFLVSEEVLNYSNNPMGMQFRYGATASVKHAYNFKGILGITVIQKSGLDTDKTEIGDMYNGGIFNPTYSYYNIDIYTDSNVNIEISGHFHCNAIYDTGVTVNLSMYDGAFAVQDSRDWDDIRIYSVTAQNWDTNSWYTFMKRKNF